MQAATALNANGIYLAAAQAVPAKRPHSLGRMRMLALREVHAGVMLFALSRHKESGDLRCTLRSSGQGRPFAVASQAVGVTDQH